MEYRKLLSVKNEKLAKNSNVSSITSSFITNDNNNYVNTIKEKSDFPISVLSATETNEKERASDTDTLPFHPFQTSSSIVNSYQNSFNLESSRLSQETTMKYDDNKKILDNTTSGVSLQETHSTSFSSSYVRKENDSTYSSEFLTEQPIHSITTSSPSTSSSLSSSPTSPSPSPFPSPPSSLTSSSSPSSSSSPTPSHLSSFPHTQHSITIDTTDPSLSYSRKHPHPKDPSNITFFPWNDDGIDYSVTCSKLLSIFKSFSGPIIVNSGLRGGLGHKLVSFYHTIVIALILRRPFYCILILSFFLYVVDWEDIYLNNLNSCFQSLRFTGSIHSLLFSFTYRS